MEWKFFKTWQLRAAFDHAKKGGVSLHNFHLIISEDDYKILDKVVKELGIKKSELINNGFNLNGKYLKKALKKCGVKKVDSGTNFS